MNSESYLYAPYIYIFISLIRQLFGKHFLSGWLVILFFISYFQIAGILNFGGIQLTDFFSFMDYAFGVISNLRSQRFLMFSRHFIVLGFTFKHIDSFELIFVYDLGYRLIFCFVLI